MIILGIPLEAWLAALTGIIAIGVTLVAMFMSKQKKFDIETIMKVITDSVDIAKDLKDAYDKEAEAGKKAEAILGKELTKAQKVEVRRKILTGDD